MSDPKVDLLRKIVSSLKQEIEVVKQRKWKEVKEGVQKKQENLGELDQFDWTGEQTEEVISLQKQIQDLEYQLRKSIEFNLKMLNQHSDDVKQRAHKWKAILNAYQQKR